MCILTLDALFAIERASMTERQYQSRLVKKLENMFPGCVLLKNDPNYRQGIPDWILIFGKHWAALDVKASATSAKQPNQDYYVEELGKMSFAAFIYPENEEEVLDALQIALRP